MTVIQQIGTVYDCESYPFQIFKLEGQNFDS